MIPAHVYAQVEAELATTPARNDLVVLAYEEVGPYPIAARARYVQLRAEEIAWGYHSGGRKPEHRPEWLTASPPAPARAPTTTADRWREGMPELLAVLLVASMAVATMYFWRIDSGVWWVFFGVTQVLNLALGYEISGALGTPGGKTTRLYHLLVTFFGIVFAMGAIMLVAHLRPVSIP